MKNFNSVLLSSLTNEDLDALYFEKIGYNPISEDNETRENVLKILAEHANEDTDQKSPFIFTCVQCALTKVHNNGCSTGYARNDHDEKICFDCCGVNDGKELDNLKPKEKICLYFANGEVTNWPGTLRIKPNHVRTGRHNIARTQTTVYFHYNGKPFTGKQYGDNSQVLHIQKTKE